LRTKLNEQTAFYSKADHPRTCTYVR